MEKALEIIGLNKVYRNNIRALENINLTVEKGDLFAFLGPNGAGKSTVIGIISSLVRITSGDVYVLGENIKKNPDFFRENCNVIGSGPFKWINDEEDISLYRDYLDKFHIFVLGLNDNIIDPFFYKGDVSLQQVYPINLLNSNDENITTLELVQEPIIRTPGKTIMHNWLNYKKHFDNFRHPWFV